MMTDLEIKLKKAINILDIIPKLIEKNKEIIGLQEWEYYLNKIEEIEGKIYKIKLKLNNM